MPRAHSNSAPRVTALGCGTIDEKEPCIHFRYFVGCGNNDVVCSAWLVDLPGCLEQLEELLSDCNLVGFGNNPNHGAFTPRLAEHSSFGFFFQLPVRFGAIAQLGG